ncbi:hypothetical protein E2C01_065560 [Portunus trituberculatus]|uniref:Uncharacterized protein n=1 Tax=Portunus trituberculatus TaxID=210409 RepID=A0A5B7HRF4_PORTR|nr:hypothetical protein [Portunus trituberculatus]
MYNGTRALQLKCGWCNKEKKHEVLASDLNLISGDKMFEIHAVSHQADRLLNTPVPRGQNVHHSLPYPSLLLVQNNNSIQQQLVFPRSTCHQNALQPALQCCLALLRRPESLLLLK